MSRKRLDELDRLIGRNIRMCRLSKGVTLAELGHALSITYQQVQKYECGENRISASRLYRLAEVLGVPLADFFQPGMFMIGKRLVRTGQVAFVEAYDPSANPRFQTARAFRSRVVLLDRDGILTEQSVEGFADEHGFRMLPEDRVATNPGIRFHVMTFAAADGFASRKPYVTRLLWRDPDGSDQSKLLLTKPEEVLAICVRGETIRSDQADSVQPNQRMGKSRTRRFRVQPPSAST